MLRAYQLSKSGLPGVAMPGAIRSSDRSGWDGAGAPGGASQDQSPARGAPDPASRSG